jgi:hypothetical protein
MIIKSFCLLIGFSFKIFFPSFLNEKNCLMLCFQPDSLDDLAWAIMHETSKLCYRVSEADVTRACNQVVTNVHAFLEKWIFHVCCWHPDDIFIRFLVINSERVTYAFPSHTMYY